MQPHLSIPSIGQPWPGQGGIYAGLCRGRDGRPDYHLILAAELPPTDLGWKAALAWAQTVRADGHADFLLPDRFEYRVLWANVSESFEARWYWTSSESSGRYAWGQHFYYGFEGYDDKSYEARARAVRRLPIDPSILFVRSDEAIEAATA